MSENSSRRVRQFVKLILSRVASPVILALARLSRQDLLNLGYRQRGVGNFENPFVSGEQFLVERWLPEFLVACSVKQAVIFDVGANVGDYATLLAKRLPGSTVHAFEPNSDSFAALQSAVGGNPNVHPWNIALSSHTGSLDLWTDAASKNSQHTTLYRDVLTTQHTYEQVSSSSIAAETLDDFCQSHQITDIHFLKIDTEGHEFEVLRGATAMLEQKRIHAVQFEFNEMNVISRVFLRDFVQLFRDFNLYRLMPDHLQRLHYSAREEIFVFQNFLAVHKDFDPLT